MNILGEQVCTKMREEEEREAAPATHSSTEELRREGRGAPRPSSLLYIPRWQSFT